MTQKDLSDYTTGQQNNTETTTDSTPTDHPSNVHTEFPELEEIPEEVPIGAEEADRELAKRALRNAIREHGHHDSARRALADWARNNDDLHERVEKAGVSIGPDAMNGFDELTEPEAEAVLAWMGDAHPGGLSAAREQYNDRLREHCEEALDEQQRREQIQDFAENPPDSVNGWEKIDTEKPDVLRAYRGNVHGTPVVAAVYVDGEGEEAAHESTLDEWREAEQASETKVNRHFVSVTNDAPDATAELWSHLQTFDADPIEEDAGDSGQLVADGGQPYPDPQLHPDDYEAHEAAPVEIGDEVLVHMTEGAGYWKDDFPLRYTVRRIDSPNGLSHRNDYVLRAYHPDPPYMVDGTSDTIILTQRRRGESWEVSDDGGA